MSYVQSGSTYYYDSPVFSSTTVVIWTTATPAPRPLDLSHPHHLARPKLKLLDQDTSPRRRQCTLGLGRRTRKYFRADLDRHRYRLL